MNAKVLSSAQTFVMKFVFPAIWIPAFGGVALALWFADMDGHGAEQVPPAVKWVFLAAWLAGTALIGSICVRLKRVRLADGLLYVGNYRCEIAVPLGSIDRIREIRWINIHPVTIHFRRSTEFGDSITFMPKARAFGFLSPHPVVAELEELLFAERLRDHPR
jgi:hypothetical protein